MDGLAYERNQVEAIIRQHEHEGAPELAEDALIRLGELVLEQKDGMAAAALLPRLMLSGLRHNALDKRLTDIKHLISQSRVSGKGHVILDHVTVSPDHDGYILVQLLKGGAISEGEYIVLLDELVGESRREDGRAASVLHILAAREFREFSKMLVYISRDSHTPIVPLARLRPNGEAFKFLPMELMAHRRVCSFDIMEGELLVAVLNPYSRKLRGVIEQHAGRRCRFFVAFPEEMDDALMLVQEALTL